MQSSSFHQNISNQNSVFSKNNSDEVVQLFNQGKLGSYQEFIDNLIGYGVNTSSSFIDSILKHPQLGTHVIYRDNKTLLEYLSESGAVVNGKSLYGSFRLVLVKVLQKKHPESLTVAATAASSSSSSSSASSSLSFSFELNERTDSTILSTLPNHITTACINLGTTEAMINALPDHVEITAIARAFCDSTLIDLVNERARRLFKAGKMHGLFPKKSSDPGYYAHYGPWIIPMAPNLEKYISESASSSSSSASSSSSCLLPLPPLPMPLLPNAAASSSASSSSVANNSAAILCEKWPCASSTDVCLNALTSENMVRGLHDTHNLILHRGVKPSVLKAIGCNISSFDFCCVSKEEILAIPKFLNPRIFNIGIDISVDAVKALDRSFTSIYLNHRTNVAILHALPNHVVGASVARGITEDVINALPNHVEIISIAVNAYNSILVDLVNERVRRLYKVGKVHGLFPKISSQDILSMPSSGWIKALAPNFLQRHVESSSSSSSSAAAPSVASSSSSASAGNVLQGSAACMELRNKYQAGQFLHLDENTTEEDVRRFQHLAQSHNLLAPIVHRGIKPKLLKMLLTVKLYKFCCASVDEILAIPTSFPYGFSLGKGMSIDTVKGIDFHFIHIYLDQDTPSSLLHALPVHVKEASILPGVPLAIVNALPDHVVIRLIHKEAYNTLAVQIVNTRAERINTALGKGIHPFFQDNIPTSKIVSFVTPLQDAASAGSSSSSASVLLINDNKEDNVTANSKKRNADILSSSTASSANSSSSSSSSSSDADARQNKKARTMSPVNSFFRNAAAKANELVAECNKMETMARLHGLRAMRCLNQADVVQFEKELELLSSVEFSEHVEDPITRERLTNPVHIGTGHIYNRQTLLDVKTDKEGKKKCPMTTKEFTDSDIVSLPKEIFAKNNKFYDSIVAQYKARLKLFQEKIAKLDEQINELERDDNKVQSSSPSSASLAIGASK